MKLQTDAEKHFPVLIPFYPFDRQGIVIKNTGRMGWMAPTFYDLKRVRMNRFGRITQLILFLLFLIVPFGCSNPEEKSQALFETAQFEEQQNNFKHARQLYQEIVDKYPASSFAYKAASRLEMLGEQNSPSPGTK